VSLGSQGARCRGPVNSLGGAYAGQALGTHAGAQVPRCDAGSCLDGSVNVIPFFGVQGYEGARMRESTSARVMGDGDCDDYFSGSTRVPRRSHIALSLAMVFVVAGGLLAGNSHTIHPGYATGKGRCLP
jgi:hypothetical protein